ncbi:MULTISPECIES: CBS domain-containing protein [Colwellia]|jgi:acetoin utilization protein AcuB|uniref:Putative acetoin utilization protein AcuB n=1 Tax=Colwellia psychrerythraea (strain 34H / ATCC BAA-681) TaxID=167879 RepID=Q47UK6_COLP3|nr:MULTISPECIES: CBS domain-containing protein [Colwellia]AAZ27768.1 putative acetoin utilization protein AcuB [Colwellia psychrerythraea 34H]PKH85967.1 CBS domain-containing protein [Colwellia sp. Bg11-28]
MKIEEIMSEEVTCIDLDDRLSVVRELFIKHKFHHLMVTDSKNQLVAVISERDYLKATNSNIELPTANEKDLAMLNKRVHQIVSKKLVAIKQFSPFSEAIKTFHDTGMSCLPVINSNNQPVGVITSRDIIKWLYSKVNSPKS